LELTDLSEEVWAEALDQLGLMAPQRQEPMATHLRHDPLRLLMGRRMEIGSAEDGA
jgi:hypothetical protein